MAFTVTTGAVSASVTASPISVPTPTGANPPASQLLVAVIEAGPASSCSATGWTQSVLRSQNAATGTTVLIVMTKIADGTEGAAVSFTMVGTINHASGRMMGIDGHGVASIATDLVVGTVSGGATTLTPTGVASITVTAGSLVAMIFSTALDASSTTQFSGYTNTDPGSGGLTERMDNVTLSGNGGGFGVATGVCAGTTTGTAGCTQAVSEAWNGVQIGIPPAAVAATSFIWAPPSPPTVYIR